MINIKTIFIMKRTLLILSAITFSMGAFGQNGNLQGANPFSHSNDFYDGHKLLIPLESLEKNNSYDGPTSIDEYSVTAGVTSLEYTYEFTYSPAHKLISITTYDELMNPLERQIYGRNWNEQIVSVVFQQYTGGSWEFDQRTTFEYVQNHVTRELNEEYNSGTMEWEYDGEQVFEYIGGYNNPSEILIHTIYSNLDQVELKIQYFYASANKPNFMEVLVYNEDYLEWQGSQRWNISEWGQTEFKSDFLIKSYLIPTANITDYIIGKQDGFSIYPSAGTISFGFDFLTDTYQTNYLFHSSMYNANNERTQLYYDIITPSDTLPYVRVDNSFDQCYGFQESKQYEYIAGSYTLNGGSSFDGETTPYMNSCFVTAYNFYNSYSPTNPNGVWDARFEINQVSNLGIDESESGLFKIYPNPSSDVITIEALNAGEAKLTITDVTGKVVRIEKLTGKSSTLNLEQLPNGIYILEYTSNGLFETSRFIKQ